MKVLGYTQNKKGTTMEYACLSETFLGVFQTLLAILFFIADTSLLFQS
jgi:hypothetical protein